MLLSASNTVLEKTKLPESVVTNVASSLLLIPTSHKFLTTQYVILPTKAGFAFANSLEQTLGLLTQHLAAMTSELATSKAELTKSEFVACQVTRVVCS